LASSAGMSQSPAFPAILPAKFSAQSANSASLCGIRPPCVPEHRYFTGFL
jgi:hypothetical protein